MTNLVTFVRLSNPTFLDWRSRTPTVHFTSAVLQVVEETGEEPAPGSDSVLIPEQIGTQRSGSDHTGTNALI